jgi:hypothetical protein
MVESRNYLSSRSEAGHRKLARGVIVLALVIVIGGIAALLLRVIGG